jgi:hypothetical protein
MRPQVLDATRVRENRFLVSPSMARHYQSEESEGGGVNGQFSPASGSLAGRFLRCGTHAVPPVVADHLSSLVGNVLSDGGQEVRWQ